MRLFAAIVPPPAVLEELTRAVDSAHVEELPEPRKGLLRRGRTRGAHAAGRPVSTPQANTQLDQPALDKMLIPISGFGNVTLGDSVLVADALRAEVATWRRPALVFAGGAALEFPGDQSVWAKLEGDLDDLMAIGRNVPQVVQRLGHLVDRRQFRPWLSVGTITAETSAPYLERVVEALEGFRGMPWTVDSVVLMERMPESEETTAVEERERMPLARP